MTSCQLTVVPTSLDQTLDEMSPIKRNRRNVRL